MSRNGFSLALLLPGLLVAATGVGAGDLITGALAGTETGVTLLWAAAVGALLKFGLNEGLARWQLATGTSLLQGWITRLGRPLGWLFGAYLVLWSFVVGGALINACAVAGDAWLRIGDEGTSRVVWGIIHALIGLTLAAAGGFAVFEKVMAGAVAVMFVGVVACAAVLAPPPAELLAGFVPSAASTGGPWTLAVIGGVGGTVTLLSYGYWIAEHGRRDASSLRTCRIDLGSAYTMTALFGMAMLVIGASIPVMGKGATVAVALSDTLSGALGAWAGPAFLLGFHAAVFSSLLGVLQGVPYLFADLVATMAGGSIDRDTVRSTRPYRGFQFGLALLPLPLLGVSFTGVQLAYAISGALFMPFVAATLLVMTNRRAWIGDAKSGWLANLALVTTLALFAWQGVAALFG